VIKVRILPIFIFFLCHVNPNAYQNWKRRWKWRKNAFCYQCKNDTRLLWMRHVKLVDLKIKIYSETSQIFFSRLKKLNLLKCAKITKSWNFKVLNKFFNIFTLQCTLFSILDPNLFLTPFFTRNLFSIFVSEWENSQITQKYISFRVFKESFQEKYWSVGK
jgi:hypothetical protein